MHPAKGTTVRAVSNSSPSYDTATLELLTAPIARAVLISGLSRSAIYRAAGEGKITLLKAGRSTLVDMASVRAYLAALPCAALRHCSSIAPKAID